MMPKPTEIRVYDPTTRRSWYLDTASPTADELTLEQLACGLRSLQRFGGYTTRPIPVDEHCVRVGRFAEAIVASEPLHRALNSVVFFELPEHAMPTLVRLAGLLHDAPEAITGYGDVLRPAKTPEVVAAEERAMSAILDLVVRYPHFEELARVREMLTGCADVVHAADDLALYYEALLWSPGAPDWVTRVPLRHFPADLMPTLNATMLPLMDADGADWASEVREAMAGLSRFVC